MVSPRQVMMSKPSENRFDKFVKSPRIYSTVTPQVMAFALAFSIILGLASTPTASSPNRRNIITWKPVLQATSNELLSLRSVTSFLKNMPSAPILAGHEIIWSYESLS